MASEEDIHQALMVIDSRLTTMDGKLNLMSRADAPELLATLETVVKKKPLIGQIYLLLDGTRNQDAIRADLDKGGVTASKGTISNYMKEMSSEHGIADQVPSASRGKTYRKNAEMEKALNLSTKVEKWLDEVEKATTKKRRG